MTEQTKLRLTNKEEIYISKLLKELGVPPHLLGYDYIKFAILLIASDESYLRRITKGLYSDIAEKFQTTPSRVERAIRHCIEVSFNRAKAEKMEEIFSYTININTGKLTNSEFLAVLGEYFRLHYIEE